jgi:hypothetical protein
MTTLKQLREGKIKDAAKALLKTVTNPVGQANDEANGKKFWTGKIAKETDKQPTKVTESDDRMSGNGAWEVHVQRDGKGAYKHNGTVETNKAWADKYYSDLQKKGPNKYKLVAKSLKEESLEEMSTDSPDFHSIKDNLTIHKKLPNNMGHILKHEDTGALYHMNPTKSICTPLSKNESVELDEFNAELVMAAAKSRVAKKNLSDDGKIGTDDEEHESGHKPIIIKNKEDHPADSAELAKAMGLTAKSVPSEREMRVLAYKGKAKVHVAQEGIEYTTYLHNSVHIFEIYDDEEVIAEGSAPTLAGVKALAERLIAATIKNIQEADAQPKKTFEIAKKIAKK